MSEHEDPDSALLELQRRLNDLDSQVLESRERSSLPMPRPPAPAWALWLVRGWTRVRAAVVDWWL